MNSRLRVMIEICKLLFIRFTRRMWYLRYCLRRLKIWLSSISGRRYWSGVGDTEFLSKKRYGCSAVWKALIEEDDSWSPIGWLDLRYDWTVTAVSISDEGRIKTALPEREEGIFREADDWDCVLTPTMQR